MGFAGEIRRRIGFAVYEDGITIQANETGVKHGETRDEIGLGDEDGRRPLLPVGALAAREADRAVPPLELVRHEHLHGQGPAQLLVEDA